MNVLPTHAGFFWQYFLPPLVRHLLKWPNIFWSKVCRTKVCNACPTTNSALTIVQYVQPSRNARQERRKEAKPERKPPEMAQFPSSACISIRKLKMIDNLNYFCLFFFFLLHFLSFSFCLSILSFRIFTTNSHCLNFWIMGCAVKINLPAFK